MHRTGRSLSIGLEKITPNSYFLSIKATGNPVEYRHEVVLPMIDTALSDVLTGDALKLYIDISQIEGCAPESLRDLIAASLCHDTRIDKTAIYTARQWHDTLSQRGNWFSGGETRCFERCQDAVVWLRF